MVHLNFNVIGTVFCLSAFCLVKAIIAPLMTNASASLLGIAIAHSSYNMICALIVLSFSWLFEILAVRIVPDAKSEE